VAGVTLVGGGTEPRTTAPDHGTGAAR
jgi:hypothetical protein